MDNYFVKGYNVFLTFGFEDQEELSQGYETAKQYVFDNLQKMITEHEYMKHLFSNKESPGEFDDDMIEHYDNKIKVWQEIINNAQFTQKENAYELCLNCVGGYFEDDPNESREYNDGCSTQYIFDQLRCIGMSDLTGMRKELVKRCAEGTFDEIEWVEYEGKRDKHTNYWFEKADNFRIVAIPGEVTV